jgi:hypothetical protein
MEKPGFSRKPSGLPFLFPWPCTPSFPSDLLGINKEKRFFKRKIYLKNKF